MREVNKNANEVVRGFRRSEIFCRKRHGKRSLENIEGICICTLSALQTFLLFTLLQFS